jgi:hypothetical protein
LKRRVTHKTSETHIFHIPERLGVEQPKIAPVKTYTNFRQTLPDIASTSLNIENGRKITAVSSSL